MSNSGNSSSGGIDLQKFCDPDRSGPSRYSLCDPFVQRAWECATDGRIAVRRPSRDPNSEDRKLPNIHEIFDPINFDSVVSQYPRTFEMIDEPCDDCEGSGRHTCCECGHESACGKCSGMGRYLVDISGSQFKMRYVQLIGSLSEVRYKVDDDGRLLFVSGDLQGVLMPVAKRDE